MNEPAEKKGYITPQAWRRPFYLPDLFAKLPDEILVDILDMLDDASFIRFCACARWLWNFAHTRAVVPRQPLDKPYKPALMVPEYYYHYYGLPYGTITGRPYRRRHRVNRARCCCTTEARDFRRDPSLTMVLVENCPVCKKTAQ